MKKVLLFFLILTSKSFFGQQSESMSVSVFDKQVEDGYVIYNISIQNESDSIICILHSIFINLSDDSSQGLAMMYTKDKNQEDYGLHISFEDTNVIAEARPRKAEFILPHQNINFKVKLIKSSSNINRYLHMHYFYLTDLCYEEIQKSIKNDVASWYLKYNLLRKRITL